MVGIVWKEDYHLYQMEFPTGGFVLEEGHRPVKTLKKPHFGLALHPKSELYPGLHFWLNQEIGNQLNFCSIYKWMQVKGHSAIEISGREVAESCLPLAQPEEGSNWIQVFGRMVGPVSGWGCSLSQSRHHCWRLETKDVYCYWKTKEYWWGAYDWFLFKGWTTIRFLYIKEILNILFPFSSEVQIRKKLKLKFVYSTTA